MKVAVIQSNYLPWRGYFDIIREVDLFVFYDDVQYTKNDWRNRNRIKTDVGLHWITVPVHRRSLSQLICETEIDYSRDWQRVHYRTIKEFYSRAPYVDDVLDILSSAFSAHFETISTLNVFLTKSIASYLGIDTKYSYSLDYRLSGTKSERLIQLLKELGAECYLSGPSAKIYLDVEMFEENGIDVEFKSYDYPEYPQLWGEFVGEVSIVDLIANCGPRSIDFICGAG